MKRSSIVEGSFLDAALWAARGASAGPTLCLVAGIHGDEINSVEIARRSFHSIDPQRLRGTLIVVPAAISLGFRTMNRYMIDRRDLNREFPGSVKGSVASIVANAVFERVVRHCDALIDLHTGSNFRTNVAQIRVDMEDLASLALAENFAVGVIIGGAGPDGIFLTTVGLGDEVDEGDLLGTVTDPVSDRSYEIRASREGVVIGAALPQVVLSGYGVFHIGRFE